MEFVFCSFSSTRLDLVFSNKLISCYYSLLHSFSLSHSKWCKKKNEVLVVKAACMKVRADCCLVKEGI